MVFLELLSLDGRFRGLPRGEAGPVIPESPGRESAKAHSHMTSKSRRTLLGQGSGDAHGEEALSAI